jgi:alkylation response protein AidB-like acyl-CoA dehydrogenase
MSWRKLAEECEYGMSTARHYKSNLRDLYFNLFEFLEVDKHVLGKGAFAHLERETVWASIAGFEKLATTEIAQSFAAGDRTPPALVAGEVRLPEPMKRAMNAFWEGGWDLFEVPAHLGGVGANPSLIWAQFELLAGANPAIAFMLSASFWARMVDRLATPAQKQRFLPQMVEKRWAGAMVLTEPDAGSDVGAGRTSATHIADDIWNLEGTKRFITSGDFDLADNIVHFVLARPLGATAGTKGLSLFMVPKFWVDSAGVKGERNGFHCTKLESKMGLKGSVTCEMVYGGSLPARGLLLGNVHDGIRQMFQVIEQARMAVGIKSMATLSTAYLNALAYAKERVQGPALQHAADKNAERVRIIEHGDVRRMLMLLKCHVEGMRALAFFAASLQDEIELAGGHGKDPAKDRQNDFLLPLVKGFCSDRCYELLAVALQVYGGAGYCQDYPMEQYVRDQKVDTLYEGTTHIQALDLFFRKIAKDGGATLQIFVGRIRQSLARDEGGEPLRVAREALALAVADLEAIFVAMMGKVSESLDHVAVQGNRILIATAEVFIGWLLIRHAAVASALSVGASGDELAFFHGKICSANFFAGEVLPNVQLARRLVEASSTELMRVSEAAF